MTPEDRAALWKKLYESWEPFSTDEVRALLSALEEAEADKSDLAAALKKSEAYIASNRGEMCGPEEPVEGCDCRRCLQADVLRRDEAQEQAESETAALRAEVERLRQSMTVPEHVTSLVASERDALRAEVETLRGELARADRAVLSVEMLPDHACAECRPNSDLIVAGFRCVVHAAKARAALSGGEGESHGG